MMLLEYFIYQLISIPMDIYSTFVLEEKYGFNKTDLKTFVLDRIKGLALGAIFVPVVYYLILKTVDLGGEYFYLYTIGMMILILMVMIAYIQPEIIMPMFNKFDHLD